jgi:hypothetical protein
MAGWWPRGGAVHAFLRVLLLLVVGVLAPGCGPGEADPASYTAEQKDVIAEASRAVRQYEDWSDRAEYKIQKHPAGWQVTAWRVEHPEAKGNARYVPWGYRVIVVDRRGKVIEYKNSK